MLQRRRYNRHVYNKRGKISFVIFFAISSFLILLCTPWFILYQNSFKQQHNQEVSDVFLFDTRVFEGVSITGKAFIVYDIKEDRILASKNEHDELPLASITKVMTAITAVAMSSSSQIGITISEKNIDGGLDFALRKGQVWSLEDLLKYMLVFSSNDAARLVATHFGGLSFFVETMNQKARSLNTTLIFNDPAGLDEGTLLGGKGTALDVVILFKEALKVFPGILDATTKNRFSVNVDSQKISGIPNTNQEVENFFGIEGSKTGFTNLAGGNLAVVVDVTLGRPVVIVVLGSTRDGRFDDVALLYELLRKSVR